MADQTLVLAEVAPSATTLTTLYTVPANTQTVVSTVFICNTSSSPTTIRLSVAPAGASDVITQYLYRDLPLAANDTFAVTAGITLQATDVIRCYSASGNVSFTAFGVQTT